MGFSVVKIIKDNSWYGRILFVISHEKTVSLMKDVSKQWNGHSKGFYELIEICCE